MSQIDLVKDLEKVKVSMFEDIDTPTDFVKPFPSYEDVFNDQLALHRKHFLPLVSIDVSVIFADLRGWLHFVTPIEPLIQGNVGDLTGEYCDFYNDCGRVAFRVSHGKYSFSGDFRFFAYESGAIFTTYPQEVEAIHQEYRERVASYEQTRQGFLKYGGVPYSAMSPLESEDDYFAPLVQQLGGDTPFGNWGHEIPRNRSGKAFRFVGCLTGFSYCDRAADRILLFYDPDEQIALLTFDWS